MSRPIEGLPAVNVTLVRAKINTVFSELSEPLLITAAGKALAVVMSCGDYQALRYNPYPRIAELESEIAELRRELAESEGPQLC